jgi:hypothetical protein
MLKAVAVGPCPSSRVAELVVYFFSKLMDLEFSGNEARGAERARGN